MKSRILSIVAIGTLILVTAALSDPEKPKKPTAVEQRANLAVRRQVLDHVVPTAVQFSRSRPRQEFRYKTEFEPRTLVNGEIRIPFRVIGTSMESKIPSLGGYYNESDDLVYLLDVMARTYVVATNHPIVKARSKQRQVIQLIPLMPHAETPELTKPPVAETPL